MSKPHRYAYCLLGLALLIFLPLVVYLPVWLCLMAGLVLFWFVLLLQGRVSIPSRGLLIFIVLGGTAGITLHYHTLFGREPGVACLVLMFCLKLLEMRTQRDAFVLILLAYFLALAQFLYVQNVFSAALMLLTVWQATASLIVLNQVQNAVFNWQIPYRLAGRMLLQALPLMIVLFVLFPRIQGPLWGLPGDAYTGMTGLSESMSPGSISQLSQSDAIAFRVRFNKPTVESLPRHLLYWRGPILTTFDGRSWQMQSLSVHDGLPRGLPYALHGSELDYVVTLEPHNKPWLFALDLPGLIPDQSTISRDAQLLAKSPVTTRIQYPMRSFPEVLAGKNVEPLVLQQALQLPKQGNPQARDLAIEWRKAAGNDPQRMVQQALAYFRQQEFFYTLSPSLLGEESVDEFLFQTRRGFCEHYAASFVFLMRAAGVPARIVTGYQGGEINPVDATMIVRQSDAHAWAEVWLSGIGWQRVDPTAAIAPSRIERNLVAALPAGEAAPLFLRPEFSWLHSLRFRWEAVGNAWNQWVIAYNAQRQRELLTKLGLPAVHWQHMVTLLSVLCALILVAYMLWSLRRQTQYDALQKEWAQLSHQLARIGLARHAWEGPQAYAQRVSCALPSEQFELACSVQKITEIYCQLRYAAPTFERTGPNRRALLLALRKRIAQLDLR